MNGTPQIQKTEAEQEYVRHYGVLRENLPGDAAVKEVREKAIKTFDVQGLPHRRIEAWKYTDLRQLLKNALPPTGTEVEYVSDKDLYRALGPHLHGFSAHHIVFVNGIYDEDNSFIISDEGALLHVSSLKETLDHIPAWFNKHFDRVNPAPDNSVAALNAAFMRDGAVVEVVKDAQLKRPLHLIYISSEATPRAITERNFVHVGPGAKVTILESYVHLRAPDAQRNCITEVMVEDGAELDHIKFQSDGAEALHLSNWRVQVGADASYRSFQFNLGASVSRNDVNLVFAGEGAMADVSGIALLRGNQHSDATLNIVHAAPGCESRALFKAVLDERARGVFQGKLVVKPDAQHTDAKQMARGLLLSDKAEFDAKPELEIYADDVVCGHGATSGQLDEEMMFYMRQRGIPVDKARSLLILAFIGEALELVRHEEIRAAFQGAVEVWLGAESV